MPKKSIFELDLVRIAKWQNRCLILTALIVFTRIGLIIIDVYGFDGLAITISMWSYHTIVLLGAAIVVIATQRSLGTNVLYATLGVVFPLGLVAFLLLLPGTIIGSFYPSRNTTMADFMIFLSSWTFVSLIILLVGLIITSSTAKLVLQLAGAKINFFWISGRSLDSLRPGHCRGCGHSREGFEPLQECPNCQRVPQVI